MTTVSTRLCVDCGKPCAPNYFRCKKCVKALTQEQTRGDLVKAQFIQEKLGETGDFICSNRRSLL